MDINTYNKTKENVQKQLNDPQKLKTYIKPKLYSSDPYIMLNRKVDSNGRRVGCYEKTQETKNGCSLFRPSKTYIGRTNYDCSKLSRTRRT